MTPGSVLSFTWEDTGLEWINVQIYMPGGWVASRWYDASLVCDGTDCLVPAYPYRALWPGTYWWWVTTWDIACGYQVQPGGKVNRFTVL